MDAGYDDINNYASNHFFGFNPRDEYNNLPEFLAMELRRRDKEKYNNASEKIHKKDKKCKWYKKNNNKYVSKRHAEVYDSRVLDWQVCPYCKRKIKIKEGK